jgi:OPA family glycerol-3-phosphate transporter-like MFS transporter
MAMLIAAGLGWRGVFAVGAAVLGTLLVICLLLLRESPGKIGEEEPAANPENLFHEHDVAPPSGGLKALLGAFFGSSVFWLACALSLGTTILCETFGLWTPTYFTQAASSSALFPLFGGISVILCGWLSDRLGHGGRASLLLVCFWRVVLCWRSAEVSPRDREYGRWFSWD